MTFLIPGISIAGHIGGFVGGILLSPFVFKKQKDLEFSIFALVQQQNKKRTHIIHD
jgi:membrane associated rhomboid family serine protease